MAAAEIAVRARAGSGPGLFWLGGFNSDMRGTKALALDAWAAEHGRACVRFDYSGHGESGGAFIDGTIGRWLEEAIAVFEQFRRGPQVVIGSSMGGWMALLLARAIAQREAEGGDARRAGADRAGAGLYGTIDVERLLRRGSRGDQDQGRVDAAVGVWRRHALSDHARADRGGPQPSPARQRHRGRMSGSHPAGRAGPRCALAACFYAGAPAAGRGRRC